MEEQSAGKRVGSECETRYSGTLVALLESFEARATVQMLTFVVTIPTHLCRTFTMPSYSDLIDAFVFSTIVSNLSVSIGRFGGCFQSPAAASGWAGHRHMDMICDMRMPKANSFLSCAT